MVRVIRLLTIMVVSAASIPGFAAEATAGQPPAETVPLRGERLFARLAEPVSMTAPRAELHAVLARIQRVEPVAVWIDPRVDPNQPVAASARTGSLAAFLDDLALQAGCNARPLGSTMLFVPSTADDRLITLARLVGKESDPAAVRRDVVWNAPITPSALLVRVRETFPETLAHPTPELPYDLWRAGALLDVTAAEALAAVLVPMDHGFTLDDGRVTLTPLAPRYEYESLYGAKKRSRVEALFPGRGRKAGRRIRLSGTAAEHDLVIADDTAPANTTPADPIDWSRQRFTLTLKAAKLGDVLGLIEQRGLPIRFDRDALIAAGTDLNARIDVELSDASVAEFAAAIAEAAELQSDDDENGARLFPQP